MLAKKIVVTKSERGLLYRKGDFQRLLMPGEHTIWRWPHRETVEMVSVLSPIFQHPRLPVIVGSAALKDEAEVVTLAAHERAILWVNGSPHTMLHPGLHAIWKVLVPIRVEIFDIRNGVFEHPDAALLCRHPAVAGALDVIVVEEHEAAVLFREGRVSGLLKPGLHAFWRGGTRLTVRKLETREQTVDLAGQEILTADHVTLRINASAVARLTDPLLCVSKTSDWTTALYREAQFALRSVVGTRTLDVLLASKESLGEELTALVRPRAVEFGVELARVGIKDLILPGEMKALLNQVTEARKAAEASVITRREETASVRHQANTAKLLENNPVLLRLRELEALERIAAHTKLAVTTVDGKLSERLTHLL